MTIILDLLKINEETQFGNFFTDEDAKLILDTYLLRSPLYGELDPSEEFNISLANSSHVIYKLWLEHNIIWGEIRIINNYPGKILKEIIGDETIFNCLKAKNRDLKIDSILEDKEDKEYKYIYPSDILKERGFYPSLRAAGIKGKLTKFFTFDIRSYDRETLFIEK